MNRRQMMFLPGVAVAAAAGQGLVQAASVSTVAASAAQKISHKKLAKYGRPASSYKVPKSAAKTTKYIGFLTTYLSLTPDQQQRAGEIFSAALTAQATVRTSLKAARQTLTGAMYNNNAQDILKISISIGTLKAQNFSNGANANAAFYQLLTPDQQGKLTQLQS